MVGVRSGFIHAWVFPCFGRYGILKQHRVLRVATHDEALLP